MKKALLTILAVSLPALSMAAEAPSAADDLNMAIASVEMETSVLSEGDAEAAPPEIQIPFKAAGDRVAPAAAGAIVNAGATAWNVVNNGQAASNLSHYYASAVPSLMFNWSNITGWRGPKEILYEIKVKNLMGITVVDYRYVVSFFYGGSDSGKGKYITNFTIKPVKLDLKWGWKCSMDIRISDPMNVGTPDNPLARLQADANWTVSSPLTHERGFETYEVLGDGRFRDISRQSRELTKSLKAPEAPEAVPAVNWN